MGRAPASTLLAANRLVRRAIAAVKVSVERSKASRQDRLPRLLHQPNEEAKVVDGGKTIAQQFLTAKQVMEVGERERRTAFAVATVLNRLVTSGQTCVTQIKFPDACKDCAITPQPRRQNAIKHIGAALYRVEKVIGSADSHDVARPIGRQMLNTGLQHFPGDPLRFTQSQAANSVAVGTETRDECR